MGQMLCFLNYISTIITIIVTAKYMHTSKKFLLLKIHELYYHSSIMLPR